MDEVSAIAARISDRLIKARRHTGRLRVVGRWPDQRHPARHPWRVPVLDRRARRLSPGVSRGPARDQPCRHGRHSPRDRTIRRAASRKVPERLGSTSALAETGATAALAQQRRPRSPRRDRWVAMASPQARCGQPAHCDRSTHGSERHPPSERSGWVGDGLEGLYRLLRRRAASAALLYFVAQAPDALADAQRHVQSLRCRGARP